MTFAEMVKNREWEKIFDILDQGTIEKKNISDGLWTMSGHVDTSVARADLFLLIQS